MRKICTRCKIEKDVRQFYAQASGKYGRTGECKECRRLRNKIYKKENPEKVRIKDQAYSTRIRSQYSQSCPRDHVMMKERSLIGFNVYARRKMHTLSNNLMNYAIRIGLLKRGETCEHCGSKEKIEGHHEDYHEPLDVIWLCFQCHTNHHINKRKQKLED